MTRATWAATTEFTTLRAACSKRSAVGSSKWRATGRAALCCGPGVGRIWRQEPPGAKERPAEGRVREAAAVPEVGILVVTCPKDLVMFQDALKTTGLEGKIVVKDLIELVDESIQG